MAYLELLDGSKDFQRHVRDLGGVVIVQLWKAASHHVSIANRLHLAEVIQPDASLFRPGAA